MKKLRQAMDGLLKTARLTHTVFRVQEDRRTALRFCNVRYRRDVCFSQAVSVFETHMCCVFVLGELISIATLRNFFDIILFFLF